MLGDDDGENEWAIADGTEVAAGAEMNFMRVERPDTVPFIVGTLMVSQEVARAFLLDSLRMGHHEQLAAKGIPLAMFDDRQPFDLKDRTPFLVVAPIVPALQVTIKVRNVSHWPQRFSAKFLGWRAGPIVQRVLRTTSSGRLH